MIKTVALDVHNMPKPPPSICQAGTTTRLDDIDVDLDTLCHQLFLDVHGRAPVPNPYVGYLLSLLPPSSALEFVREGPATHKEARVGESNKYGKAFCRWFLYTHFGKTYFHHMDHVLGKSIPPPFNAWLIARIKTGDTPDYLCTGRGPGGGNIIRLGEAKGTQAEVGFKKPIFQKWRDQFGRIEVRGPGGATKKVKGWIVASQLRIENHKSTYQSKVFAEDPETPGEANLTDQEAAALSLPVISGHYADVFDRIGLPLQAAALRGWFTLPQGAARQIGVWECLLPALSKREFVGGIYPPLGVPPLTPVYVRIEPVAEERSPFFDANLLGRSGTFFGLDKQVFSVVRAATVRGLEAIHGVEEQDVPTALPVGVSFLRDGSLMAPHDFMVLRGVIAA